MPKIELRPHKGKKELGGGRGFVEVEFDQEIILVDGREVGIIGKHKGAGLCLHNASHLPESSIKAVKQFIAARRNEDSDDMKVAFPPAIEGLEEGSSSGDE